MGTAAALVGAVLANPPSAGAQFEARLTGQMDSNLGFERQRFGDRTFETLARGSLYGPSLDGFVWSPRFLTFSASGVYVDQSTSFPEGRSEVVQFDPYRLRLNLFPEAPHSVSLHAARSVSESTFSADAADLFTTTTTETQGINWAYRGDGTLPEASLGLTRQTTESLGPDLRLEETRTDLRLRLRKSLERATPTLNYVVEHLDRGGAGAPALFGEEGLSHRVQYDDRIRVGERGFLTPLLGYRRGEEDQSADAAVSLVGPLSTTLDGSAGLRYNVNDRAGTVTQTASADGTLTHRVAPTLTVSGGANGALVDVRGLGWSGGVFGGLAANPLPHLRHTADYGVQVAGGLQPLTVSHRGHLGAVSTFFTNHTLSGDYYLSVFDPGAGRSLFVSHSGTLGVTSTAIPLTTVDGRAGLELQDGDGRQDGQTGRLGAAVTPLPSLTLRGAVDGERRTTSGGGRAPTRSTAYAGEAGIEAAPLDWLTLSFLGRRGIRDVQLEDRTGTFVTESLRGAATFDLGALLVRLEGFLEREPVIDLQRQGARASVSYRFRVWTISLEAERAAETIAGSHRERERYFVRVSRPLNYRFAWP